VVDDISCPGYFRWTPVLRRYALWYFQSSI
jgi:hypothetical protein